MRQGTLRPGQGQAQAEGWQNWIGEGISLLMALILVGTMALIGGFAEWDAGSVMLMTFVLWILLYFGIFQFLERYTP